MEHSQVYKVFSASYTKLDDLGSMHEGGYNLEAEA